MYVTSACGANALIQLKSLFEFDTEKLTTVIEFLQDLHSMRFVLIRFGFMVCGFTYIVIPYFSTEDPPVIFTDTCVTTRTYGPEAFSCQVPHTVI